MTSECQLRCRQVSCLALVGAFSLAVGACGGGSGGLDDSQDPRPPLPAVELSFVDITEASPDLAAVPYGGAPGWDHSDKYAPGVALVDLDDDGALDLVQPRNDRSDSSLRSLRIHRGLGDGTFVDVTSVVWDDSRNATCALAFDYDGDDDLDLFIGVADGASVLYRNDGGFAFTDVTASAGIATAPLYTYAAAAGDVDGDGDLDLYVGTFNASAPDHGAGTAPNLLFLNHGDGTFSERGQEAGVTCDGRSTLGLALADLDGDGDLDIYVANDFFEDCLYENPGPAPGGLPPRFDDVALEAGILDAASRAMGVAVGDLDGDLDLDIVVTDTENPDDSYGNAVFVNRGGLRFDSLARELGLDGLATLGADWLVSWGVGLVDLDLDGDLDVHVATHTERKELLWRNDPDGFTPYYDAINSWADGDGRGSAYGDIDGDGDIDMVVGRRGQSLQVLRNDSAGYRGLTVAIRPYHRAPGARVMVRGDGWSRMAVIQAGEGYLSSSPPVAVIGVGQAEVVDVEVELVGGVRVLRTDIAVGGPLTIDVSGL